MFILSKLQRRLLLPSRQVGHLGEASLPKWISLAPMHPTTTETQKLKIKPIVTP